MITVTSEFQAIYEAGEVLHRDIQTHLITWPVDLTGVLRGDNLPDTVREQVDLLQDRAHKWFNLLTLNVLPHTPYERSHTNLLLRRIAAAIRCMKYYEEYHHQTLSSSLLIRTGGSGSEASIVWSVLFPPQSLWRRQRKLWRRH
jgi:hypothetical protein